MKQIKIMISNYSSFDRIAVILFFLFHIMVLGLLYCNMMFFYLDAPFYILHCRSEELFCNFFQKTSRIDPLVPTILLFTSKYISTNPAIHFFIQWGYWFLGLMGALLFLNNFEKSLWKRICIICLLFSCSTFAENMFTLAKFEIMLNTCIIWFVYSLFGIAYGKKKLYYYVIYELSLFFAMMTKETWIIVIVPVFLLTIYCIIWKKNEFKNNGIAALILLFNIFLYAIYRHYFYCKSEYTSYSVTVYDVIRNIMWYVKYHMDIMIVGLLGLGSLLFAWIKDRKNSRIMFLLSINITGWCYLVGISLWRWTMSYYIYCMVAFFSLSFIGFVSLKTKRIVKNVSYCILIVYLIGGILYNYKVAFSHIDLGKMFSESIKSIEENTQNGDRILCENYNFYEQPIDEANYILEYDGFSTKLYGIFQEISNIELNEETLSLYGVTNEEYQNDRYKYEPQVGDYLLIYNNKRNFRGPIRAVNPSSLQYGKGGSYYISNGSGYKLALVDKSTINRKWLSLGDPSGGVFSDTVAGYALYRVEKKGIRVSGLYEDGWSGKEITLNDIERGKEILMNVGEMAVSWRGEDTNTIRLVAGDKCIDEFSIKTGDVINLTDKIKGNEEYHTLVLIIDKLESPKNYGGDDSRDLGAIVSFEER